MNYILFSIDNVADTHTLAKFLRFMDTQIVMGKTKGKLVHCIGMYKGDLEQSFLCSEEDYNNHIVPLGFTKKQECTILISGLKMECFIDDNFIGNMIEVPKEEAFKSEGFIYRPDLGIYWIIK